MPDNEKPLSSRLTPVVAVVAVLVLGSLFPKGGVTSTGSRVARDGDARDKHEQTRSGKGGHHKKNKEKNPDVNLAAAIGRDDATVDLAAYEDLGSWIDIYDSWLWAHPTLPSANFTTGACGRSSFRPRTTAPRNRSSNRGKRRGS